MKIIKSLYGEKQAPKIWSDLLHSILVKLGFERFPVVACLYKKTVNDNFMYLCVHVDDGLVMSNSEEFIADFLEKFRKEVNEIRIFKPIKKYLGIEVKEKDNRIHVSQSKYI